MPEEPLQNAGSNTQASAQEGAVSTPPPATPANPAVANTVPSAQPAAATTTEQGANGATPAATPAADGSTPATGNAAPAQSAPTIEGDDLFEAVADMSMFAYIEPLAFNDGIKRKIDCFFLDKASFSSAGTYHLNYGKEVSGFKISQNISSYGFTGTVDIKDISGSVSTFIDYAANFYFVINIFEVIESTDNNIKALGETPTEKGYMFQPYIFEIEDSDLLSPDGEKTKLFRLSLVDMVSATLKKVCYGNLLLQYPNFITSANFVDLYKTLLEYANLIINFNLNKKFKIDTHIFFVDDVTDSITDFLKEVILKDLPIDMNCYELLNLIYKKAAREIEPPADFAGEKVGNILLPLLLMDELEDTSFHYRNYFNRDKDIKITKPVSFNSISYNTSGTLIKRGFYAKCIAMPFEMAFNEGKSLIFENINPQQDAKKNVVEKEKIFNPSNGFVFSPLKDTIEVPPQNGTVGLACKNLALLSDTVGGSNNMLVYFNWIYEFFKSAFLKDKGNSLKSELGGDIKPVLDPHFLLMQKNKLDGGDAEAFAKINANTIVLKSQDSTKEALYYVGRAIKTYIMLNSLFGFKIKGSYFRHPGEIIKLNSPIQKSEDEGSTSAMGGIEAMNNGFVLAYMTSVTHIAKGNEFEDLIYASKICKIDALSKNMKETTEEIVV